MDFQAFTDSVAMPCCVLSVAKTPEGGYGEIRILCSNAAYKQTMGPRYYDNMPYYELVPRDNKFEDFCYRAAILGQRMHAYVETKALGCWTDQTLIPLASDREDCGYCQFIFEFTQNADAERMSALSADTSAAIIKACITLMSTDDFRQSVGSVLEDMLAFSSAEACRIMLFDQTKREVSIYSERCVPGVWPERGETDVISYDLIQSWEKLIGVSNALILQNEQDFAWLERKHPFWASTMREHGVKSLLLIPLRRSGVVIGYLYVVNFDPARVVEVKELAELLSYFLASEIANQLLLQRLDQMSNTDALTGLQNRNAMIQRMHALRGMPGAPAGILNLDLNGLKRVNDQTGHDAGDRMLIQASELLCKVFYREDLYRTGGDEFVVLISPIDRETFERKVQRLRAAMEKNSEVSFAIGDFWSDGSVDLQSAFRCADERMYADKADCYRRHPEWARR